MRRIIIIFLIAGLFVSCNSKESAKSQDKETSVKDDYQQKEGGNDKKERDNDLSKKSADDDLDEDGNSKADIESIKGLDDNLEANNWTSRQEETFVRDCRRTAEKNVTVPRAKAYCKCMLEKLKVMYPSYEEMERKVTGMTQLEIKKLADGCN